MPPSRKQQHHIDPKRFVFWRLGGATLAADDIKCWADQAYQGAGPAVRLPFRGKGLRGWRRRHNRDHARIRSLGERAMDTLKCWRLLRKLRCSTTRITAVVRAVIALELAT